MENALSSNGLKSFRVKYKIGSKKYWRDVSADNTFDARLQILFKRGLDLINAEGEQWLNPEFLITEVVELPIDYVTKPRLFTIEEMAYAIKENIEL